MRIRFTLLFLLASILSYGQTTIGRQLVDQYPVDAFGDKTYGLTWLPTDYSSNPSTKYPLIIFLHGSGETGSTVNSLNVLITQSPPALPERIANGFNATAKNPKDGKTYEFIVCSPQAPTWSYGYNELKYILPGIMAKYRVDPNRIYLTGLSAGGGGAWTVLASGDKAFATQFAAMACVNTAGVLSVGSLSDVQVAANLDNGDFAGYGVNMWSVTGVLDGLINTSWEYMNAFNRTNPAIPGKYTQIADIGHSTWGQAYDPAWRPSSSYYGTNVASAPFWLNNNDGSPVEGSGVTQDSLNLYEWLLLSSKNVAAVTIPPVVTPPPPVAPSGPAYSKTIPGHIEAEDYDNESGVMTQGTADAGGGLNVGWIDNGDWMDYNVNVTAAGSYTVNFRIATPNNGSQLQLQASDGTVLTTVTLPNTGDYQLYQTVSATVTLPAGNQTLRLTSITDLDWNINWLEFSTGGTTVTPPPTPPSNTGSGTTKMIMVDLYGGSNGYTNPQWNDWNIEASAGSNYFTYSDGSSSSVSGILSYNEDLGDNGLGYGSGMAPAEVLRYSSFSETSRQLYIAGLDPTKTYDIEFYASRNKNANNSTVFGINNIYQSVSTFDNLTNKVVFTNLTPDGGGEIVTYISSQNDYNYINGFAITEHTNTSSSSLTTGSVSAGVRSLAADSSLAANAAVLIYPNPAHDQFNLQINDGHTGRMIVQVVDASGAVKGNYVYTKDQYLSRISIPASGLPAGTYFIHIQVGSWSVVRKALKL